MTAPPRELAPEEIPDSEDLPRRGPAGRWLVGSPLFRVSAWVEAAG